MKFDTIIMGGGLSGLTAGIALARAGKRVAIVAAGQNTLHFNGGSLELLGTIDGKPVSNPCEEAARLPQSHPYNKIGVERIAALAAEAQKLLAAAGIETLGDATANHYRLTPLGVAKPAWLTLKHFVQLPQATTGENILLVNVAGFLDFPANFVAKGLREMGATVREVTLNIDALARRRGNASEMRATNLARVLVNGNVITQVAQAINEALGDETRVLMPAIMGLDDDRAVEMLKAQVSKPLHLVATLPPSVPGTRINSALRHYFQMLGGTYLMGDTAAGGTIEGDRLKGITTTKLGDTTLRADHYIMATGSFMSRGLQSNYQRIYEPVLNLDVDAPADHAAWTRYGVFNEQPYMSCGVTTVDGLHPTVGGRPLTNVQAIGALLAGHNPVKDGDATGVDMLTALAAAHEILGK